MDSILYTIGHSNHDLARFFELLAGAGVTAVADVRSQPYSRYNPQYNRENLQRSLKEKGVAYVFLGRELGARSDDPACYEDGKVSYVRLAATALFRQGLDRVVEGMKTYRVALLCAEGDPLFCHRSILVTRRLVERGVPVRHVHPDGAVESQEELEARLLQLLRLPERDLFRTRAQVLEDAYIQHNRNMSVKVDVLPGP